ncbi:hypothetical protein [Vacuolonema iberomarrocanum]|uniref:hypothetical protein n=1 Tax=Vacuolonema iberomarrocanum TaxID=3454632 RepID=UPI001A0DAF51|nr:hypothetical protein [filamentous cyanobacterium LEGE 07170]
MGHKSNEKNPKVRATETIWSLAVGMFAICIPLVAITESGVMLPLLVSLSAGGGTAAVWLAPDKRQQEEADLAQTVKTLEERVMNLETIYVSLPDTAPPLLLTETDEN